MSAIDPLFFETWCEQRGLTSAERRVLRGAVDGYRSNAGLATRFGVKVGTLKKQVANLCGKLNVESLRDAVIVVLRAALEREGRTL